MVSFDLWEDTFWLAATKGENRGAGINRNNGLMTALPKSTPCGNGHSAWLIGRIKLASCIGLKRNPTFNVRPDA